MGEISQIRDVLYKDIRTFQIGHALSGKFVKTHCRLPLDLEYILRNGIRVGVIPSFGGAGVGVL
jgi:hypothetical protein